VIRCEICGRRPAAVHVTRVTNGQKVEQNLCEQCALERGELPFAWEPHPLQQLLAALLQPVQAGARGSVAPPVTVCPTCGTDYAEFAKTSLLGCPDCYKTFRSQLEPILQRVHGAGRHRGKVPGPRRKEAETERLREELKEAVKNEDYERAAQLRDQLRALGA